MGKHTTGGGRRTASARTASTVGSINTTGDTLGGRIQVVSGAWTGDGWRARYRGKFEADVRKMDNEIGVRSAFFNRNGSLDIVFNKVLSNQELARVRRIAGKGWRAERSDGGTRFAENAVNETIVRIDSR